jgi:serine/threonine protein kinase
MPIRLGQILMNQFRVDAFLASGGMGAVYQVFDLKRNVPLAMKVLHSEIADDPAAFRRFQQEAGTLQQLQHPYIVPFYGLYQQEDLVFILEGFINGPTLKEIIRQRRPQPLSLEEALVYLRPLCSALGYAHACGFVHCDIKPGNVMLDSSGRVYLADFGIARYSDATATTFASAGTPAYMAPEQVMGRSPTPRTDIYALGILTFELLIGQRPFKAEENSDSASGSGSAAERIRRAQLKQNPPNPSILNPAISPAVAGVILRTLSKDPALRYGSTAEFFDALCAAAGIRLEGMNERAAAPVVDGRQMPVSPVNPPVPASRQRPVMIGAVLAGIILLVFIMVQFSLKSSSAQSVPSASPVNPTRSQPTSAPAVQVSQSPKPAASQNATSIPPTQTAISTAIPATRIATTVVFTFTPTLKITGTPSGYASPVAPAYFPLPGCASSHLRVKDSAFLNRNAPANKVLTLPDLDSTDVVEQLSPGDVLDIADGPVCSKGQVMWYVHTLHDKTGWISEGNTQAYGLLLIKATTPCSNALASRLKVGDIAFTIPEPAYLTNLRSDAGLNTKVVDSLNPGQMVKIIEGPRCSDNQVWWHVLPNGSSVSGWLTEGSGYYYLAPAPLN